MRIEPSSRKRSVRFVWMLFLNLKPSAVTFFIGSAWFSGVRARKPVLFVDKPSVSLGLFALTAKRVIWS